MNRERGAALAMTLVLALLVLMLGIAAARSASHAHKTVRYERDRQLAFASAEAALADAERDLAGSGSPGRRSLFATAPLGLSERCGAGADDLGLCSSRPDSQAPNWQAIDLAGDIAQTVGLGTYTGAELGQGRPPRYLIEFIPPSGAGSTDESFFRVTAIGFGERAGMQVVLQSIYRRAPDAARSGRISWREIGNWRELHRIAGN